MENNQIYLKTTVNTNRLHFVYMVKSQKMEKDVKHISTSTWQPTPIHTSNNMAVHGEHPKLP